MVHSIVDLRHRFQLRGSGGPAAAPQRGRQLGLYGSRRWISVPLYLEHRRSAGSTDPRAGRYHPGDGSGPASAAYRALEGQRDSGCSARGSVPTSGGFQGADPRGDRRAAGRHCHRGGESQGRPGDPCWLSGCPPLSGGGRGSGHCHDLRRCRRRCTGRSGARTLGSGVGGVVGDARGPSFAVGRPGQCGSGGRGAW